MNIFTILIPLQGGAFLDSEDLGTQFLRSLGFRVQNRGNFSSIPRLGSNFITDPQTPINPFKTHLKKSEYFISGWADTRWSYRKNITIDSTEVISDLTNFPMLIDLYDKDLQADAQASGNDIMFTDNIGNILDHEIEDYTRVYNSTHAHLVAWVRLNLSSSQDTIVSMYYGNPTAINQENPEGVWDDNYKGAWHLKESPAGTNDEIKDSTTNDNDGYTVGMDSTHLVTSKIGKGLELDGTDDMIIMNDSSSLDSVNDEGTLSCWLNWVNISDGDYQRVMTTSNRFFQGGGHKDGFEWAVSPTGNHFFYPWGGSQANYNYVQYGTLTANGYSDSQWHYFVVTLKYSTKDVNLYLDGNELSLSVENVPINWTQLANLDDWIWGADVVHYKYMTGMFDEIRVSDTVRSTGWIQTEYNNQYAPDTFFSVANEENSPYIKDWPFPQFSYRKNITIQASKVTADLLNFPVLIDIQDSDLKNDSQASGNDIIFTDTSGNQLDHEIEKFEKNSTHAHLITWVRMNLSSTEDTPLYMYFGNPTASNRENPASLWDSNYSAVWHLEESPNDGTSGGHEDSTVNDNDGTPQNFDDGGGGTTDALGKIGGAVEFAGDSGWDYITIPNPTNTDPTDKFTVSVWVRKNSSISGEELVSRGDSYCLRIWASGRILFSKYDGSSWMTLAPAGINVSDNDWHYIVGCQNTSGCYLYLDGNLIDSNTNTNPVDYGLGDTIEIGRHGDGSTGYNFTGIIDEVRISRIGRSDAWIATEYENQANSDQFYTIGNKETYVDDQWAYKMFKYRKDIVVDENQVNVSWFDVDWRYRKQITLSASSSEIPSGYTVSVTFDHEALVNTRKSRIDGDDIRIIYWNGTDWVEIDRILDSGSSFNTNTTKIWFKTQALVPSSSSDNNYYLYYGNLLAGSPPTNSTNFFYFYDGFESADLSGWNTYSTGSAGDSINASTDQVNTGSYSAKCEIDNVATPQAIVWEDFTDQTNLFARIQLYLDPSFSTTGHVTVMQYIDTSSGWQNLIAATINDDMTLYMWNAYYGEAYGYQATNTISKGVWHTLEMQVIISETDGEARLWLDGNLEIEATGRNTSSLGIDRWAAGIYWASPQTEPNTIYIDDGHLRLGLGSEPTTSLEIENEYGLTNFPLLVNLSDPDLHNPAKVQADGDDILFTDVLGNKLDHEIELFDQSGNGTHAHLVAWVRIPTLYATRNTEITMYYGNNAVISQDNPSSVWISYEGIWHLSEDPSGTILDSSNNSFDGTSVGSMTSTDLVSGQIYNCLDFDGADDYINVGTDSSLKLTSAFTIEGWFNGMTDTGVNDRGPIFVSGFAWGDNIGIRVQGFHQATDKRARITYGNGTYMSYIDSDNDIDENTWTHIVVTYDGTTLKLFINGVKQTDEAIINIAYNSNAAIIGANPDNNEQRFNGSIDEIRVSSVVRSLDWIITEYNNHHDPTSFYSIGSEEIYAYWWADASFLKKKDIAIDHNKFSSVETDQLVDFPFLLELYDSDLKTGVLGDGNDILFFDDEGRKLHHEIELFDQTGNGTHAHLFVWVRIPYLYLKESTILSMYYGNSELTNQENPEGVWTDDYVAVWHLKESGDGTAGEFQDSTLNANDGQGGGGTSANVPTQATGMIGMGQSFDGSNDDIQVSNSASLGIISYDLTVGGWVYSVDNSPSGSTAFKGPDDGSSYEYGLTFESSDIWAYTLGTSTNQNWLTTEDATSGWHFYVYTFDGSIRRLYVDGVEKDTSTSSGDINPGSNKVYIGWNPWTGTTDGIVDEVRISSVTKTADWIKIEYENQNAPDSLHSIGAELTFDKAPPQIDNFGVDDQGTGVGKFWVDISDDSGVQNVELTVNNTKYSMIDNGTHWVYELAVSYLNYYEYLITNASDIFGNYRTTNSSLKNYSFNKDTVAPNVLQWIYITESNTFHANVTDSWGEIDTVTVNVTTHNLNATMAYNTTFGSILAHMNDTISMPNGPIDFQIIVNDTGGNEFISTTHSGTVYDNHPPVASDLTLSRNPSTVLLPIFSNCTLHLDYTYYDEDGHGEDGTEIRWYKNSGAGFELQSARNDTDFIPASELVKGHQWYATVRPKDGELFGDINQTATTTIQNTPPQVSSVVVSPSNPVTTQSLAVSNTTTDDDGDSITAYQIRWYNPSYNLSYDDQATISSAETTRSETWWCELRAFDGTNYSSWFTSNSVTIENSAPSASNLAILPSTPQTADILTADYDFTDADNDLESGSIILWYKNGILQGVLNDSLTVDPSNTTKGDTWYFKITPSDGTDQGLEKTSDPVTILNTAPTANSLFISPASLVTTTTLMANYTWADSDPGDSESGSEIIWYRNNVLLGALNGSLTVDPSYTTKGDEWHFKVRPSDGADYGTWTSCPTNLTIDNTAPEVTDLAITPSDPKTGNDLTASYTWIDNDTIDSEADTIIYWYLNRTGSFILQSSYTNQSILSSTATRKGDWWKFGVNPSDGADYGSQLNSSVIIIGNTPPLILNVTINGYNETTMIGETENLTVNYTYYDADNADDSGVDQEDLGALEIRWYNQSQLITALNDELVILAGNTSSGEIWYCIIRVNDGSIYSNPTWSPSVSIAVPPNTPPEALNVLITPSDPKTGGWLNVTYVYYDEEGDPESFTTFRWYCNGIHQGQFDGIQNLSSASLIKGDTWYAEVRPRDDSNFGDWNTSANVVIGNTPPEATSLEILPVSPLTGNDLSVDYDWTDVDGADTDTNSIIYWYLNRTGSYVLQPYTNQTSVPSTATLKGDLWLYELIPNDGTDLGSAINSTPLLIGNTAPTVSNLEITPLNPITGDDLTADYDWLDQDTMDSEAGSQIRWYKNGVLQPAYNDSLTINAVDTAKGENWYFTIIPSDGIDQGSVKTSPLLTIGNTAPTVSDVEFTPGVPIANIDLSVTYNWTDVDLGDSESGTLIRWYRNDVLQGTYNDTLIIDGIMMIKDDNWTVSIKASDGTSLSSTWVNTSIIVGNTAPTVTTVTISPSSPKTQDALEVSYAATDNDSIDTIVAYSIEWYLEGAPQPQFNNFTIIPAINTSKGENWQAHVRATDGEDWSDYLASLGITIGNTKPSVTNVSITGGLTTSSNITLSYEFVDVDNDPSLGTTITWRYVGYGSGTYDDLLEIPASYTKAGQQWWVEITPRDTDGAIGETFNSWDHGMIIIIGNSPPTLNVSDIAIFGLINGTEYPGENFDTTHSLVFHYNATDIDGDQGAAAYGLNLVDGYALGSEYRWYRNRTGVVTLIVALNDQVTVPAQYTQKGDHWWVQIRVRDFFGDFSPPKNASKITISNAAPHIQNKQWSRTIYYTTNSLIFSYLFVDYDAGDEEQGLFTRWYRNGTYLPEYDNNVSILAQNTTKGDRWYVNISVWDGTSYSVWSSLPEITIINSAPSVTDILILPSAPNTTQALNVSWVYADADGDAEELTAAQISWYRNGIVVPSLENNHTVPASWTNREEVWYFTVQVTDGVNYSILYQSNTISVINSAPSTSTIQINLGMLPIYTSDDLTVTWGFSDPDPLDIEDVTSTFILWYLNGELQASFTNDSIIPASNTLKGQQWVVSIAVRDNGGLWSDFLNSSAIVIANTPPQISDFIWNDTEYYTNNSLSFSYLFSDADNDVEIGILIRWYRNGIYQPEHSNNITILAYNTTKGDRWFVNISVFDGETYSSWYSLLNISILNSAPSAFNITLVPEYPNTTQLLEATWKFQDIDADIENQSAAIIQWYQNGNLVPDLANQRNVSSGRTRGGDSWYFIVSVFDGSDYSISYQSNMIQIINSPPITLNIQLNAGEVIYTTDLLTVSWLFDDPDPQDIENTSGALILWYLNGTIQPQFTNRTSLDPEDLIKGQVWVVTVAVRDNGGLWSVPLNSSSVEIANSIPDITLHVTAHPEFIVEDQTLRIQPTFYTYADADGDNNHPQIWWYRNNIYLSAHDNSLEIPSAHTTPGDTWYYILCPYDGTDLGDNHTSPIISVESRPNIDEHDVEAQETMDGLYHLWVTVSDTRNNVTEVRYDISLNDSTSPLTYTLNSANTTGHWVLPFQLEDYAYLGTTMSVTVTVTTNTGLRYSQEYTISNSSTFTSLLVDAAPPRIMDAYFVPDEDSNPNALIFYCKLEEYGSGIDQVILYYSFKEVLSSNGGGATVKQTYRQFPMNKHNESSTSVLYSVTIPFSPNGTDWEVLYQIQASDKAGNLHIFNIPEDPRNFIAFNPPGVDPTIVLIIVGITLFLAFFGSIVYVKFIRKPELVGLDKELVLNKLPEISDAEVMSSLDVHTIGIVVSFFDQRHGPIPIIVIPEMLKDNFTKLVELSDRSFSGTGFSDDFDNEIPSSYDFVVSHGLRTSIMSFGYALERPQARGGQENLTLNIIVHQDLFPLVQSFQKVIQHKIHKLHVLMDKKPDNKEEIRKQVFGLRKYVSSIILSYERIYGTTELIEEED